VIRSENNNADIGNNRYAGHKRFFPPLSRKKLQLCFTGLIADFALIQG